MLYDMSYGQRLVNSQVNINRAVFEMNCNGHIKSSPAYKEQPDLNYIREQVKEAIDELYASLKQLNVLISGQMELEYDE